MDPHENSHEIDEATLHVTNVTRMEMISWDRGVINCMGWEHGIILTRSNDLFLQAIPQFTDESLNQKMST